MLLDAFVLLCTTKHKTQAVDTETAASFFIAAAASEPEANERGSSLVSKDYIIGACNHFF